MGPWSRRVHDLLRHLTNVGFDGAPRFLGIDDHGREMLGFIDGEVTVDRPPHGVYTDEALTAAARLLRRLHDATTEFAAAHPTGWRFQVGAPSGGPVICHNDLGPYNTVYRAGRPVAFIDWDFAAPAPREWDIAYALWRFVPLYDDATATHLGWPTAPRGPRIAQFLNAYGLDHRADILTVLHLRQQVTRTTIQTWANAGDPAFLRLQHEGRLTEIDNNITYAQRMRHQWEPFLT
jgi:Phosphotransferase enzyme family